MSDATAPTPPTSKGAFLRNVLWGWGAVAVNLVIGLVLPPIIIGRLGAEQYGTWALLFATVDYFRMLDFGFRAATVNACARSRARGDWSAINREVSAAGTYFFLIGLLCIVAVVAVRGPLLDALNIPGDFQPQARTLLLVIAVTVALRLAVAPLTAVLEGFQRFDLVNHAQIGALVFRSVGSLAVLLAGYGLVEMAVMVLAGQVIECALTIVFVRRIFPGFRIGMGEVDRQTMRSLFSFGRYSAVLAAANLVSIQGPSTVLGFVRGPLEVAFFTFPFRLLMYSAEGLAKVADVTSSVTAALDEMKGRDDIWRMAVVVNRSCFTLFMPAAVFLLVYGHELLTVWTPEIAPNSAPLIPILVAMFLFGVAGQYNAGAILIGQGRHATYSYAVVVEVLAALALTWIFGREYGAYAAAWAVSSTFVLNRALFLAVLICRQNGFPLGRYLREIYLGPVLAAAPVFAGALWLNRSMLNGDTWTELILAGTLIAATYFTLAWVAVVPEDQRRMLRAQAARFSIR